MVQAGLQRSQGRPGRAATTPATPAVAAMVTRETLGGAVAEVAEALGTPLMPWQRQVADVAMELDPRRACWPTARSI